MKTGIELIAEEGQRQIEVEGWTPEHDDEHDKGQLAKGAHAYIEHYRGYPVIGMLTWPWDRSGFKPTSPIRVLVKAGALIAAEIDRLLRLEKT